MWCHNRYIASYYTSGIFYVALTLCSIFATGIFVDQYILAKWLLAMLVFSFWGTYMTIVPQSRNTSGFASCNWFRFVCLSHTILMMLVSLGILLQIYVIGNWKNPNDSIYPFDNVTGAVSCITPLIPFALYGCKKHANRLVTYIIILTAFAALLSMKSRTGIISASVTVVVYSFLEKHWDKKYMIYLMILLVIAIIPLTIILRPESVIGRFLIWVVSFQMIGDKPLFGFGMGGFERYYMDYQAAYFSEHPASILQMYADNIRTPFNEYILILVNWGIVGMGVFLSFLYLLYRWYRRSEFKGKNVMLCSLMSIAVISFPSYPMLYPFAWIIMTVCVIGLVPKKISIWIQKGYRSYHCYTRIVLCAIFISLMGYTIKRISFERKLYQYYSCEAKQLTGTDIPEDILNSGLYMFERATIAYNDGRYAMAASLLNKCSVQCANYDVTLYLGTVYMKMEEYDKAWQCMVKAHNMIPSRFYPLYYMALISEVEHRIAERNKLCKEILSKRIKVYSSDIMIIRHDAKKMLKTL